MFVGPLDGMYGSGQYTNDQGGVLKGLNALPELRAVISDLRRQTLTADVQPDTFLNDVADTSGFAFLKNATQGLYQRHAKFTRQVAERHFGRAADSLACLDWGCGLGHFSYLLRKEGLNVSSCDVNPDIRPVVYEPQNIHITLLDDDVALPFEDGSFDIVTSCGVLEHAPKDAASMKEINRILRPGGLFVVSFLPYKMSWTQRLAHLRGDFYHDRLYWKADLQKLADHAGMSVVSMWHGQLFPKTRFKTGNLTEKIDRLLTDHTPLRYFATNIEAVLVKDPLNESG